MPPGHPVAVSNSRPLRPSAAQHGPLRSVFPVGWHVDAVTEGGQVDPVRGAVRWGPFLDARRRSLAYRATPPARVSGAVTFSGFLSVDGSAECRHRYAPLEGKGNGGVGGIRGRGGHGMRRHIHWAVGRITCNDSDLRRIARGYCCAAQCCAYCRRPWPQDASSGSVPTAKAPNDGRVGWPLTPRSARRRRQASARRRDLGRQPPGPAGYRESMSLGSGVKLRGGYPGVRNDGADREYLTLASDRHKCGGLLLVGHPSASRRRAGHR